MRFIITLLLVTSLITGSVYGKTPNKVEKERAVKSLTILDEPNKADSTIEEDPPQVVQTERVPIHNFSIPHTEEDVYLLAQLITQEAGGQVREGQIGVGNVVLNRVLSEHFPDTVRDVIYDDGQFSGAEYVAYVTPTDLSLEIAENVLSGVEYVFYDDPYILFFRNPGAGNESDWGEYKYYVTIGDHAFYSYK